MCFFIDRSLNILKWPTAVALLLCAPEIVAGFSAHVQQLWSGEWLLFWCGFAAYLFLWRFIFSARLWGSWLPTFIHEFNHAVVALITLHRISDFHASYRKGGHVRYVGGEGNWLITIAPYVVPTISLFCVVLQAFCENYSWYWFVFGAALGFDVICVWRECHLEQTDLKELGFLFSLIVIPLSNLIVLSSVFIWMQGGTAEAAFFVQKLLQAVFGRTAELMTMVGAQIF
ncbi:MAG: hypothetical protein CMK59_02065 [Proteobacteria bacterium]|nr:hypothetical protein [Pseudomonadota bacterium]